MSTQHEFGDAERELACGVTIPLTDNWRYCMDPPSEAASAEFDDSDWRAAHVPHNARELANEASRSKRPVCFRRTLDLPRTPKDWRVLLETVTGPEVTAHVNGELAVRNTERRFRFLADITERVRPGKNLLALFTRLTGIQGGVWLHVFPPTHWEAGDPLVDTGKWRGGPARVRINATVRNEPSATRECVLAATVCDPAGAPLARAQSAPVTVRAGTSQTLCLESDPIENPPLWSPSTPHVCIAHVKLFVDGVVAQSADVPFGFRWFRFDPDEGFFLNGARLELRGIVYPEQGPYPGDGDDLAVQKAFPARRALWDYEMSLMKGMGANLIRSAGGASMELLAECDRAGMLITPPLEGDYPPAESVGQEMADHARFGYNHPALLGWHFNGEGKDERTAARLSEGAKALREMDPARPVICVDLGGRSPGTVGLIAADVIGEGTPVGYAEGSLDQIGPRLDEFRRFVEDRYGRKTPIFHSGYGILADSLVHTDHPRRNDWSVEFQTLCHRRWHREVFSRKWMAGGVVFVLRDITTGQAVPRHTWKGVLDVYERKRDVYYYYQSRWTEKPMVHVAQQDWTPRDVWPPHSPRMIEAFSNCDVVELLQNGVSLGKRTAEQGFCWEVRFSEGANELRAIGEKDGETVGDTARIEARFLPPAVEPRVMSTRNRAGEVARRIEWDAVPEAAEYETHRGDGPDFTAGDETVVARVKEPHWTPGVGTDAPRVHYYKICAAGAAGRGRASIAVGGGPGQLRWRFAQSGWLASSPALVDLDGDGRLEVIVSSLNGCVYALNCDGSLRWEFDTKDAVHSSPVVAPLRDGEGPIIVFNDSDALYALASDGHLLWRREGVRHYSRSHKSPSMADLDGDGQLEILAPSDTGELLALDGAGKTIWRFSTRSGAGNRGLNLTAAAVFDAGEGQGSRIAFSCDDGATYLLDGGGKLLWRSDHGIAERSVGVVPNHMAPAAGRLSEDGPIRILCGAGHLKVFDLSGALVWEKRDISGVPVIVSLYRDGSRQIIVNRAKQLHALNAQGEDLWRLPVPQAERRRGARPDAYDWFNHPPVCADLDSSGTRTLLAGTRSTYLCAISAEGRLLWRYPTEDEITPPPAVADIDGDGVAEVVFCSRDGFVYVLNGGQTPADALKALQYRGGPGRTGTFV